MRLLSYNILDGGGDRLEELSDVITRSRPDLVALVEAEDPELVQELARRLKMDFVVAAGKKGGSALLSKWDIRQSINHALLEKEITKSFLEAIVLTPRGDVLPIAVVHLHARAFERDEQVRERELAVILRLMEKHRDRGTAHLLCGDFNADAPTQKIDPARCKPRTQEAWQANGGQIPRRVVQMLLDHGYLDTLRAAHGEAADTMTTFTTEHPGQRVDHIYVWGLKPEQVREAWIEAEPAARASDHFAVGADLGP